MKSTKSSRKVVCSFAVTGYRSVIYKECKIYPHMKFENSSQCRIMLRSQISASVTKIIRAKSSITFSAWESGPIAIPRRLIAHDFTILATDALSAPPLSGKETHWPRFFSNNPTTNKQGQGVPLQRMHPRGDHRRHIVLITI